MLKAVIQQQYLGLKHIDSHLRATAYADQTNVSAIKEMIPYK